MESSLYMKSIDRKGITAQTSRKGSAINIVNYLFLFFKKITRMIQEKDGIITNKT